MPDRLFALPRLANVYDALDPVRDDLDAYEELLHSLSATSVVDVGCGTGTLAVRLAARGIRVIGVDPAAASLDVARRKPGAERVTWIGGYIDALPPVRVDAVTMTGNVAQVFVDDDEWFATLRAARSLVDPNGHLIFETRNPDQQAYRGWTKESTYRRTDVASIGNVACWEEVTRVTQTTVSFRTTFVFERDQETITSESTLRFRPRNEIITALLQAGFEPPDIRDAPDRPGLEFVFIARAAGQKC